MWKRKQKFKEIDDVLVRMMRCGGLAGVHVKHIIPIEPIHGKMHIGGFVPNKFQPKQIFEILFEQLEEKRRNSRT
jgi:hypothetical protein